MKIALYLRLSKEDAGGREESASIAMQRILLRQYAKKYFAKEEIAEYVDDGYTGVNLRRPGLQAMLEGARSGELHCIIVKDFSRFSRDYLELGSYLEQIFPFLGVRFISVNDGYDSGEHPGDAAGLEVNFRQLLYDWYSKDLSGKVRAALAARKGQGKYVSANCPFGYEKDPLDRHGLVVVQEEAQVVRRIFALTEEGLSSGQIAGLFNETGVKTPIEFKLMGKKMNRKPKGDRFLWSASTVCKILRNEAYIGSCVQKKTTKEFVGGKNRVNPRENWLVFPHHHEAIVDQEAFARVQGRKRPGFP